MPKPSDIPAAILAGGRSSRMGVEDKCLLDLNGRPILAHIVAALRRQAERILIISNSTPAVFDGFHLPVRPDVTPGRLGPLAGVLTAMLWARDCGAESVFTVPADMPFLPHDLLARMAPLKQYKRVVALSDGMRVHPTIGLWPVALAPRLLGDLQAGARRVQEWCRSVGAIEVVYPSGVSDHFFNINTPRDAVYADLRLRGGVEKSISLDRLANDLRQLRVGIGL